MSADDPGIALTRQEDRLECQGHLIQFEGNRDAVRRQSVEYALNLLRAMPKPV